MIDKETRRAKSATWLHFSDSHFGMREHSRLWSRFRPKLNDDLALLLNRTGPLDFIVFSGDMTQRGAKTEFSQLNEEIGNVLDTVGKITGKTPKIVAVPGNHDLTRPGKLEPQFIALSQYWTSRALQEGVWGEQGKQYRDYLHSIFGTFMEWQELAISSGLHAQPEVRGLMPGDCSYRIETSTGIAGLVALNSTWLQLDESEYQGKLHVDALQLFEVVGSKVDEWVRRNDVNLLITHHPSAWLNDVSITAWTRDVNPPGRFDLHLFGHMHDAKTISASHGGGYSRQSVQAASLFGLEKVGDNISRIQGYSAGSIKLDSKRVFTSWPRRMITVGDGDIKLVPDQALNLNEATSSFSFTYEVERDEQCGTHQEQAGSVAKPGEIRAGVGGADLQKVKRALVMERAHGNVRRMERDSVVSALRTKRIAWLASDWGMGEDAFVAGVESTLVGAGIAYEFDFSNYSDRDSFFSEVKNSLGVSFQQVCDTIANVGSALIVFSGVVLGGRDDEAKAKQIDVESIAQAVADFAPHALILIVGPQRPRVSEYDGADLVALDEADLAVYVRESELGSASYASVAAVAKIMRHTDGVPSRIDMALRDLEVGSLQDLQPSNPDFVAGGTGLVTVPPALASTVVELRSSGERGEQRAYSLLLALSALPQGEQLTRMRRFFGANPIHLSNARELLDRSLIQARTSTGSGGGGDGDKVLVVPKLVRDYVRESIDSIEAKSIDRKALELYFGDQWGAGDISGSYAAKRVGEALCDGYEIQNMSTLVVRSILRAQSAEEKFELDAATRLGMTFVSMLMRGNHYRDALTLSEDIISHVSGQAGQQAELDSIRRSYAECLRMTGNSESAIEIFEGLDRSRLSKNDRQSVELDMALCYRRLKRYEDAVKMAEGLIPLKPRSSFANHARAIIADLVEDADQRVSDLQGVLAVAIKAGQSTVANNVRLDLAAEYEDEESRGLLREVIASSGRSDFYTTARAIVDLAELEGAQEWMTEQERSLLVDAYYYIYNERLMSLFGPCHDALWRLFEQRGDRANLLNLFRHSSFIWRLSGMEGKELKYLRMLASSSSTFVGSPSAMDRNGAYLLVRIAVVLGESARS